MTTGVTLTIDEVLRLRGATSGLALPKARNARSLLAGSYRSSFRGRGMEFDEVRPYQAGDDIRTIDWRVTARTNETYTKLFREERERPVYLFIDQSATMKFGTRTAFKSITAARIASMLAWATSTAGDRIGAIVFDDERHSEIRPVRGQRGVINLAKILVDYCNKLQYQQLASTPAWQGALNRAKHFIHPGSHLIFISDFHQPNEVTEKQLTLLKRHNDISLIFVYDAIEKEALPPGRYTVSNGSIFHTLSFNRQEQKSLQDTHIHQVEQFLSDMSRKHGIHTLQMATDTDLEQTLLQSFRSPTRGQRRG